MANIRAPFGFAPSTTVNWKRYFIPQSDTHAYRVNDCVVTSGGSDAAGVLAVTLNPGNLPARGLIVAVDPANPTTGRDSNLVRLTIPKVKTRDYYVWVLDDPNLEFTVQDDGLFPQNLVAANVGKACNFNPGEADGTDLSTAALLSSTFASGAIVQVLGLYSRPGNVIGPYGIWRCRFRLHELSAEAPGVTFDDLGGPTAVAMTRTFIGSKWINKVGYTVLITGASTNARNNNEYNIPDESTYSRDALGNVQFDCNSFPDCDVGRTVKIACDKVARVLALITVTSVTDIGGGKTRIRGYEQLFGMPPREAIGAGSMPTNTLLVCHDMQASPSCMDWVTKLNLRCGGVLNVINMAIGGSTPDDWLDPELIAYIEGMVAFLGPFDMQIWDAGYGNALTDPSLSADAIVAQLDQVATWLMPCAKDAIFHGTGGARPGGDDHLVSNPWLLVDFTTQQRVDHWLRAYLTRRWQTCEFADIGEAFQRYSLRGAVDMPDLVAGLVSNRLLDAGGIHYANAGCDVVADTFADLIIPKLCKFHPFNSCRVDTVYVNTTADLGGRYNPNGMVGWYGACDTAVVNLPGIGNIGTAFKNITVTGSGFNHNMSAAMSVEDGEGKGRKQRLVFTDKDPQSTGGAYLQLKLNAITFNGVDYTFAQLLNDPKFSGPCYFWLDWGVYGFVPDSVAAIQAGLFGTTPSGTREICSFLANKGGNAAFGTQRGWTEGFDGVMLAGNRSIIVPQREVYSEGALIVQIQGTPNLPLEQVVLELREMRFAAEQQLI
jgi:hypothetical protein